jgi:hypothetical protein
VFPVAGGKGNSYAQLVLEGIFQASFLAIPGLLANASSPLTSLYISLHTANPGAGGSQSTSEAGYIGYARQAVPRSGAGWSVSNETISNAAQIKFPQCTAGSEVENFVGLGTAATGAGNLLYFGQLTAGLSVSNGIIPVFRIGSLTILES